MKKNLILGLILTSVLLMSVIGVSAQITGESVRITGKAVTCGGYAVGSTYGGSVCRSDGLWYTPPGIEITDPGRTSSTATQTSSSSSTEKSSDSVPSTSRVPRGMMAVEAANNMGTCYILKSASSGRRSLFRGRFLGGLFE